MTGFLVSFAISFGVIFVAELGDKSQLMALTFATRYRATPVLVGITLATALVHAVSVAVGYGLGTTLPTGWIALVAALAFVGFGAWTLRGDCLSEQEQTKAGKPARSATAAVFLAFLLAELGDKTMLATITLATQHGWFGTWLGSTLGMVVADALAIAVGHQLGSRLPERVVAVGAAVLFFAIGGWLLVDSVEQLTGLPALSALAAAFDHHVAGWLALGIAILLLVSALIGHRRTPRPAPPPAPASRARRWARVLFAVAVLLGLPGPLLVAIDQIEPIALFDDPGLVTIGAALALLGAAVLRVTQASITDLRRRGGNQVSATRGVHARVRHPGLTGLVVATAGLLLMAPTSIGVLAAVLVVVAVQVQVHAVREPELARLHGAEYLAYAARTGRFLPKLGDQAPAGPDRRASSAP